MRHLLVLVAIFCAGCASYRTPGAATAPAQLDRADAAEIAARQPSPQFPLKIGVVRVQAAHYQSNSAAGLGAGRFSVLDPQELLRDAQLRAISQWPSVAGAAAVDPGLLPARLDAMDDLRLAAAKMQADVLLVYTVDTRFLSKTQPYAPGSKLSLGKAPDAPSIATEAAAVFVDVRTGFVYGAMQAAKSAPVGAAWNAAKTLDAKRLDVEAQTFSALLEEADKIWGGLVSRYQ